MKKLLILLVIASMLLSGCAAAEGDVTVLASFYPVFVLAENVLDGVDGVQLLSLTAPSTGCLHDYQLLPRDMRALSSARMLLINGAGMESFLPDVESQYKSVQIVDCSQGVTLLKEEDHDEEEREEGHDHGEYNAHIWLDPQNAVKMVENMEKALAALLPDAADRIHANARQYTQRLLAVDEEVRSALKGVQNRTIVTFHEAFPYFAAAYDLQVAAVVALEPEEPISPRMLAEVIEKVKAAGNPPLFSEPQYANAALTAIARETGAPVYQLDPLVTGDGALTAYEDVMRGNLAVLLEALGQ